MYVCSRMYESMGNNLVKIDRLVEGIDKNMDKSRLRLTGKDPE